MPLFTIQAFIFFKTKMQSKQTKKLSSVSKIQNITTDLYNNTL